MRNRKTASFLTFFLLLSFHSSAASNETWDSPKLDKKTLTVQKPIVGEHSDFATFTTDLVRVQWRDKDPIYLYIMVPKLVRNPPVILYLYNYDAETDRFLDHDLEAQLTSGGVAAVGFSSALSGHRYHDRGFKQWFVSELQESLATTSHDVPMILDYLATRGDVDTSRAAMFGVGSGATISILAASADPRIKALGLLNPWGDWPDWVHETKVIPEDERPGLDTKSFLDKVALLDPISYLPQLKIPISLQFVYARSSVPRAVQSKIESAAPPQAQIVPNDQALLDFQKTGGQSIVNWIKERLQTLPSGT